MLGSVEMNPFTTNLPLPLLLQKCPAEGRAWAQFTESYNKYVEWLGHLFIHYHTNRGTNSPGLPRTGLFLGRGTSSASRTVLGTLGLACPLLPENTWWTGPWAPMELCSFFNFFFHDISHVSMPFSQILPPSPSPTESIRLFYTSVSPPLPRIQGYRYHLSKLHIYALVYCIYVFPSGLLHSVQ